MKMFGGTCHLNIQCRRISQAKTSLQQVKCPPKQMLNLNELYGVIFRKIEHFITPDMRISINTVKYLLYLYDPFMHLTQETYSFI
jgi:hypothetical protein